MLGLFPGAVVEDSLSYRADVESIVGLGVPDERGVLADDVLGSFELVVGEVKHKFTISLSYFLKYGLGIGGDT